MARKLGGIVAVALMAFSATAEAMPVREPTRIGGHAMIVGQPLAARQSLFREAARLGVSHVRIGLDLENPSTLDQNVALARRYGLRLLVVVYGGDYSQYGTLLPPIVEAHPGLEWEILNEPDGGVFYKGTSEDYRQLLDTSYEAIRSVDSRAAVLNGGLITRNAEWVQGRHDISNAHARPSLASRVGWTANAWGEFFGRGFQLTEFGYSADPRFQSDPAYRGERGQAGFYRKALPALLQESGRVYVTLRDLGWPAQEQFHHEGLLAQSDIDNGQGADMRRRPAFGSVTEIIRKLHPAIGENQLRVQRLGRNVSVTLRGDPGCRVERKIVLHYRTHHRFRTLKSSRTNTQGRTYFRTTRRKLRLVVRPDGVCQRVTRTR